MLKGCQREMIVLQTQESALFESAYFILRRQKLPPTKQDMVEEANRIIGVGNGYLQRRQRRGGKMLFFLLGAMCGATLLALIYLLIGI